MRSLDPRLVELYDVDNSGGPDHDYFRALADRAKAATVVDLGCGTGLLTVTLARDGRRVLGVDPDLAMLDFASRRPGGMDVEWVHGDSQAIGPVHADLVVMSGNVAQALVGEVWARTLTDVFLAMKPGATLAFESRNPAAQAWTRWNRRETYGRRQTDSGPLVEWLDVVDVSADHVVTFEAHNLFTALSEHLVYTDRLAFRSVRQITSDLKVAGLRVSTVWGGWLHEPLRPDSSVLVFEVVRPDVDDR